MASRTSLRDTRDTSLRASELRYRRLFETAQDGILILNSETGRILDSNPFISELLGYTSEELVGKQLWELGLFEDVALAKETFQKLQESGYARYENLPMLAKDKSTKQVEFVSNSYRSNGDFVIQCNIRDVSERATHLEELVREAETDYLTGIANRRHFQKLACMEFRQSARYGRPLSILALDIDHFKDINDKHGHIIGDKALQNFANTCQAQLRKVDFFGRSGGEEFHALLPETGNEEAIKVAEKLRSAIEALVFKKVDGSAVQFTVSIGVASLEPGDDSLDALIARADSSLYDAKHEGRNRVCSDNHTAS